MAKIEILPSKEFRVLMTIGCLNIGGAERRLLQLVQYLKRLNSPIEFVFFVISGAEGKLDSEFRAAGAQIVYGRPSVLGIISFARFARHWKPHLVHANSESAGGFYCLAGRLAGVRQTISHIRSCGPLQKPILSRHALIYEPLTSLFSNVVLGVSSATARNRNFRASNWRVIHNGIDSSELEGAKKSLRPKDFGSDSLNFIVLGRLDKLKNIRHAIYSFAGFVLQNEDAGARLHIVGPEGNQSYAELAAIAKTHGVRDRVFFPGPTNEPLRYFMHAQCALLCSDYEGLPGSVLESLACGTPVVASDIAPVREVANLTSGIAVVPVSDKRGWVAAMNSAIKLGREKIAHDFWDKSPFALSRHAEEVVKLWSELSGKELKV